MKSNNVYKLNDLLSLLREQEVIITKTALIHRLFFLRKMGLISKEKIGRAYSVTKEDLVIIVQNLKEANYIYDEKQLKEKCFTMTEALELLKNTPIRTRQTLKNMFKDQIISYKKVDHIPKHLIYQLKNEADVNDYVDAFKVQKELKAYKGYVTRMVRKEYFKDVKKIGKRDFISRKEIEEIQIQKSKRPPTYSNQEATSSFSSYLATLEKRIAPQSHSLFEDWAIKKINNSNGRPNVLKAIVFYVTEVYQLLLKVLEGDKKEIFNLDDEIIEHLLGDVSITLRKRKEFLLFRDYSLISKSIPSKKRFKVYRPSLTRETKEALDSEKEVYPPSVYHQYYLHVQEIEKHIGPSIENRSYANMWLYVIMHLTNNWRANDIIYQMPNISLENIGVSELDWFNSNRLTLQQAQLIANELYLYFQNQLVNKTSAPIRFYLAPPLLMSFATSIALCELHSRIAPNSFNRHKSHLLGTFFHGDNQESFASSGLTSHKLFFKDAPELKDFKSMVMNRSTMVYFFHNVVDGKTEDTDLALDLTQTTRSHLDRNTTSIYVETSNQDGSINRVSLNLFNRGHFGWTYNFIIQLLMNKVNFSDTLEERTNLIQQLRNIYTPYQIEGWSQYFVAESHRETSLAISLAKMDPQKLGQLLYKIFIGEMPSKHREGQCLTHPTCIYVKRTTCFGCESLIPMEFLLFDCVTELKKRVDILRNTTYEAIIRRESRFIDGILHLLSEANEYLGKEKLSAFITSDELRLLIDHVSDKLALSEG